MGTTYGLALEASGSILVSGIGDNPEYRGRIVRLTPNDTRNGIVVNLPLGTASGLT